MCTKALLHLQQARRREAPECEDIFASWVVKDWVLTIQSYSTTDFYESALLNSLYVTAPLDRVN